MHSIVTRPPTNSEEAILARRSRIGPGGVLLVALLPAFYALVGYWAGRLVEWAVKGLVPIVPFARSSGLAAGAVFGAWAAIDYSRYAARERRRARADLEAGVVQEVHVEDPEVVQVAEVSDRMPVLAFDIGGGTLLYLWGQWLVDPATYGVDPVADGEGDGALDRVNLLPDPHGFPSSAFTLVRAPRSGVVFRIRVEGRYRPPGRTVDALERGWDLADSEVLEGQLSHLADVLRRAVGGR